MKKVYGDGFLHYKNLYNGCSVGLDLDDGSDIKISRMELADIKSDLFHTFLNKHKITNNVVEYFALYSALYVAGKFDERVHVFSDSQTVVKQFTDNWGIAHEHLQMWYDLCWLVKKPNTSVSWTSRKVIVEILGH